MSKGMTLESAPPGTLVVIGHPSNGHTAIKREEAWRSNYDGRILDLDPRDVTEVLYVPGRAINGK